MRNHSEPMQEPPKDAKLARASPRRVKIYGERNTGTTYLEQLLLRNLHVDSLRGGIPRSIRRLFPNSERARDWYFRATSWRNLGWKHAFVPSENQLARARPDTSRLLFLTLTKNPYAWLLSLYRQPYHAKRKYSSLEQFLEEPWQTVGRENTRSAFANPVEMWNQKNAAYLALGGYTTALHCRYEELLADPLGFLERLCSKHGIQSRRSSFKNVHEAMKGHDRGKTFDDYRAYYLNERWRAELDDNSIRLINERLDPDVMTRFGYPRIEAECGRPLAGLASSTDD